MYLMNEMLFYLCDRCGTSVTLLRSCGGPLDRYGQTQTIRAADAPDTDMKIHVPVIESIHDSGEDAVPYIGANDVLVPNCEGQPCNFVSELGVTGERSDFNDSVNKDLKRKDNHNAVQS